MNARMNMPEQTLVSTGALTGYWGKENYNGEQFYYKKATDGTDAWIPKDDKAAQACAERRGWGDAMEDNNGGKFWRYYLTVSLSTGLATCAEPLPKDVPVHIKLTRGDAAKALLATHVGLEADENGKQAIVLKDPIYTMYNIKIEDPVLHTTYVVSEYYDRRLAPNRISSFKYKFTESAIYK